MGALALFATSGCTSGRVFVADASAERIYRKDKYDRECVQKVGPPACAKVQANLNLLEHHEPPGCDTKSPACVPVGLIPVANRVQQLGKVPADEKKEIRDALKATKLP